jgi:glycosyltransferase involved in cell wall biosynthesis
MNLVSVIIPCFNYGHFIGESIASVLNQTYENIEVIIINDGSTDNTAEVVDSISRTDARVKCYSFPNAGLGESRNRGLDIASGDFIQFLDADDLIERRKFEEQVKVFVSNPEADIVYGSVRYFRNSPFDPEDRRYTFWGKNKEWMPKFSGRGSQFLSEAVRVNFSHLSSPLFRRSIVNTVGKFDNDISAVADHHFLQRCAIADAFFIYKDLPETFSLVRWHSNNMSRNFVFMKKECIKAHERLIPLLTSYPEAYQNNLLTIKVLETEIAGSWRKYFMSGSHFDFIKPVIRKLKIEGFIRRMFYK